jgi:hypothetical protein
MQAITIPHPGGPEVLTLAEMADPIAGPGEILIEVAAAGVNRADIGQRLGIYPSPPGTSPLPGMEVSGTIAALGHGVGEWSIGDRVCALLPSGGYASLAVANAAHVLEVPDAIDLIDAAGLPETIATVWSNVFMLASLRAGETFLVHGGSSGIGTTAIQLARAHGALVATTAGSAEKLAACDHLGAEILINYRTEDFVERIPRFDRRRLPRPQSHRPRAARAARDHLQPERGAGNPRHPRPHGQVGDHLWEHPASPHDQGEVGDHVERARKRLAPRCRRASRARDRPTVSACRCGARARTHGGVRAHRKAASHSVTMRPARRTPTIG